MNLELTDFLIYCITTLAGWLIRYLQEKSQLLNMKKENTALLNYINKRKQFNK